ncbi:cellulase family glycosylhydrolase [uncultured Bacteroides sp.]|uniref:cellulase family glycosylhydrolase n=1 Tax=uncultured Bacteroides sp. TaxID=162156 RepID=UPI002AAB7FD3|nr:cellulase family glycosylhydrolase [uncultured Bacteroides sp.]
MKKNVGKWLLLILLVTFVQCTNSKGTDEPVVEEVLLSASPLDLHFDYEGGEKVVSVKCSGKWDINIPAGSWCLPSIQSSKGDAVISLTASGNDLLTDRVLEFTVSSSGASPIVLKVKQDANPDNSKADYIEEDKTGMSDDALTLASKIKLGWNLGNSMEVPANLGGETGWNNPKTTKTFIDVVKAAGFNAVRIPCAWDSYIENRATYKVKDSWLARVKEVVDYCIDNDMYVILNIHWDGGWLENNPTMAKQGEVNREQQALWKQIAINFRTYDEHLLFAGTNEVHVADVYSDPTTENNTAQQSYNQTFIDAVRATGGRNRFRNLIVQTYNTNIAYGVKYMKMPIDVVQNRMMVEVHYYDPYDFALNGSSSIYYWGMDYKKYGLVGDWGQEGYLESTFALMKTNFVDKGYPVILGEFGAIRRSSLVNDVLGHHLESRAYYLESVTATAKKYGMVPFYWDNGDIGNNGMGIFDRFANAVFDKQGMNALLQGSVVSYPY